MSSADPLYLRHASIRPSQPPTRLNMAVVCRRLCVRPSERSTKRGGRFRRHSHDFRQGCGQSNVGRTTGRAALARHEMIATWNKTTCISSIMSYHINNRISSIASRTRNSQPRDCTNCLERSSYNYHR